MEMTPKTAIEDKFDQLFALDPEKRNIQDRRGGHRKDKLEDGSTKKSSGVKSSGLAFAEDDSMMYSNGGRNSDGSSYIDFPTTFPVGGGSVGDESILTEGSFEFLYDVCVRDFGSSVVVDGSVVGKKKKKRRKEERRNRGRIGSTAWQLMITGVSTVGVLMAVLSILVGVLLDRMNRP
jgi:hypothetical protein